MTTMRTALTRVRSTDESHRVTTLELLFDLVFVFAHEGGQSQGPPSRQAAPLNRRQEAHLVSLVRNGEYSTAEVADLFGVGRSTVYRAIERQRLEARAGSRKRLRNADPGWQRRPSRIRNL